MLNFAWFSPPQQEKLIKLKLIETNSHQGQVEGGGGL